MTSHRIRVLWQRACHLVSCFTRLSQGWVTVRHTITQHGRVPTDSRQRSLRWTDPRLGGASSHKGRPAVTQPLRVRQRLEEVIRTDVSAPSRTSLSAGRLDARSGRCRNFAGKNSAVGEPSVGVSRPEPKILSAITDPREFPPYMIPNGGLFFPALLLSLRSAGIRPPQLGNQSMFRRMLLASPGSTGVDSKTGAAIQRPALPGEPR